MRFIKGVALLVAALFIWGLIVTVMPEKKASTAPSLAKARPNPVHESVSQPITKPEPEHPADLPDLYPVARDQANWFEAWLLPTPDAGEGSTISTDLRRKYANTQHSASEALLAYEKADEHYAKTWAIARAAGLCKIRSDNWAYKINLRLNQAAGADVARQNAKKALSQIELDTGDKFSEFTTISHQRFVLGNDPEEGCAFLAAMPFLATLDRYEAGMIDELPRPEAVR